MNALQGIYDANQIIGKTLFAARPVPIKRYPAASYPVVYTAPVGASIGKVESWVMNGFDLWWMFYDQNNKPYYAKHEPSYFSIKDLKEQGAQTVLEVKQAQEAKEKSWFDNLFSGVGSGAKTAIAVGAFIIGALLIERFSRR